jgi:hypothetical protein
MIPSKSDPRWKKTMKMAYGSICAMTFGEMAYMLLNQTFVYVTMSEV